MMRTLLVTALLATSAANAADTTAVKASGAWIRVLPGGLPAGGYVTLENSSDKGVAVTGAESADYGDAMIHKSSTETGMGRMEMVDKVPVPAKGKVAFAPGGYHVMLMQPKHPVNPGDKVVVTFSLSDGTTLPVTFEAKPANATGP
ncbi:copper chaperone PCu(A)C [Luteibacter aegosomatissinici]|uniref:copper chaperone PCu(A)C n=1 Tax=Luteibacter aegosomatissinici TaxID=2911539 RepID=UPI001FF8F6FF|nr:copper chaperone PCu(A)C [Luteibacter aegosomatissinici]UPG96670.1 copper chaperone PCu(A)C [Luteibacter aegosomatissinici]